MKYQFFTLFFLIYLLFFSFTLQFDPLYKETVPFIYPEQLFQWLYQDKNVLLLDTRSAEEYKVSHLEKATLVNYKKFSIKQFQNLDKNQIIIVYCSVGFRSERIGEKLLKAGFSQVYNLYGGIFHWFNQDKPIVDHQGKTNQIHGYSKKWSQYLQKGNIVY
ncbi:MAG: rhodanese-like domain-containing protein [Spirochaetes bacterium]|nr:rhodanese-like domain-containing protein [Spirochaetota bacterium]